MASQQAFQAYPNNKGTLVPGQTINVNNYTVSVERYLSQGSCRNCNSPAFEYSDAL